MHRSFIRVAGTVVAAATLGAMSPPSDPVGVYGVIDRVVVAPDTTNPTTAQIWGTFAVTDKKMGDHYVTAKGYLYYRLNSGDAAASRAEWADLRHLAGTKTVVGFSAKWQSNSPGRVRCPAEAAANADEYPLSGMGVVQVSKPVNSGFPIAKDLLSAKASDVPCGKVK